MKAVVIIARGWNTGWLGCYGAEWLATPSIDRFAAESVVFDQHVSIHPAVDQAERGLLSARFGVGDDPSLIPALRAAGVRTIRVAEVRTPGPADDWDQSIAITRTEDAAPGKPMLDAIKQLLPTLTAIDNWLLWIETDRLLPPWSVSMDEFDKYSQELPIGENDAAPAPWDEPPLGKAAIEGPELERLQATYASVVSEWDADLAMVFKRFAKAGLDSSVLWTLSSSHGLALAEHEWVGPDGELPYEELIHVPLLLKLPGGEQAGRRVETPTASIDLMPTLIDWFAQPTPPGIHGRSLLPLARGDDAPLRPYAAIAMPGGARALLLPDWRLLQPADGPPLLIRKPEDRWDVADQRLLHLEWADYLRDVLTRFFEAISMEPLAWPACREYDDIIHGDSENDDEHGAAGERGDDRSEGEGGL
jgi:hypothetical protein